MIEKIDIKLPEPLMSRLNAFCIMVITGGNLNKFKGAAKVAIYNANRTTQAYPGVFADVFDIEAACGLIRLSSKLRILKVECTYSAFSGVNCHSLMDRVLRRS